LGSIACSALNWCLILCLDTVRLCLVSAKFVPPFRSFSEPRSMCISMFLSKWDRSLPVAFPHANFICIRPRSPDPAQERPDSPRVAALRQGYVACFLHSTPPTINRGNMHMAPSQPR
jgi:hypothetical protein